MNNQKEKLRKQSLLPLLQKVKYVGVNVCKKAKDLGTEYIIRK